MAKALSSLAVGATIEVPVKAAFQSILGETVVFKLADKDHKGYPSGAATLITDKIISLLSFDAKEPDNSNGDRQNYGNNRYLHSNMLQWLNSNAAAGNWYSAQHSADQSPSSTTYVSVNPYSSWAGFLAMLDDDFAAALMDTTVTTAKNTVTDGGSYETVTSKMFLASTTEIGLASENSIEEGSLLALFSDDTSRVAYCTQACVDTSQDTSDPATTAAWYWWLRTPFSAFSYFARYVSTSGALGYYDSVAYFGNGGVRPLCNLLSSILVSDTVNSSGNYEFQWNEAPTTPPAISGQNANLGTKVEGFTHTYTITDSADDTVTVVEAVDGKTLRTYTPTLGQVNTLTLTGRDFTALSNAQHTITITATDSTANSAVRTLTFTKRVVSLTAYGITPANLLRTLPDVLRNDEKMLALASSIAGELSSLSEETALATIYANIDTLPEDVLDALATDFKVDWWSYDYSLAEKRGTLKASWYVHRRLGTKRAVESALSVIYEDSKVVEWFDYGGEPYHFKLIIPVDEATLDPTKHSTVLSLVAYYKNLRSVLDDIEYHGAASAVTVYTAAAFAGCEIIDSAIAVNY